METKKQTAVDMFCLTISDHIEALFNGSIQQDEFAKRMTQSYNQALEMEKEQIMNAFENGHTAIINSEQYYKENYGK